MKGLILLFSLIILLCHCPASAQQNVTGEWYGIGYVKKNGEHSSYLAEMILKQKGSKVTGTFNYYFKTDSFSTSLNGAYHADKRWLELYATPILNYQAKNKNGADCPMEGDFTLMASLLETTLTGQFNPTYESRILCPAITIKFTKYIPDTASQAKGEIDEENSIDTPKPVIIDTARPVIKKDTAITRLLVKDTLKPVIKRDTIAKLPAKPVITPKDTLKKAIPVADTIRQKKVMSDTARPAPLVMAAKDTSVKIITVIKRPINPNEKYIRELYRRAFEPVVAKTLELESDSLVINFYDNGEIDGDTISVFYNRKPVLLSQRLSDKPITLKLRLDTTINEVSMFADNLGRIPPNTAVAIIQAGGQRFELNLSSSLLSNATVRFRKKPPAKK